MKVLFLLEHANYDTEEELYQQYKIQLDILHEAGFETTFFLGEGKDDEEIISAASDCEVIMACGNPRISRHVLENCPRLVAVQRTGIGVNSIDGEAATELGIPVMNVAGYCIEELAVHAAGMILSIMRDLPYYDRGVRAGNWPKGKGKQPLRISNLTMGIVGLGGSGRKSAKIWHDGFGCRIIAYDPYVSQDTGSEYHATMVDFDTLCREADLITIHCPLTKETRHMFDDHAFSMMKPNAIIANTARGPIIEQSALVNALENHKIKGAGLDVFESEPVPEDNPLNRFADCTFFSPHSAFKGKEANHDQKVICANLQVALVRDHVLYTHYVTNPDVLSRLTSYEARTETFL